MSCREFELSVGAGNAAKNQVATALFGVLCVGSSEQRVRYLGSFTIAAGSFQQFGVKCIGGESAVFADCAAREDG